MPNLPTDARSSAWALQSWRSISDWGVGLVWILAAAACLQTLFAHAYTPATVGLSPSHWPSGSSLPRGAASDEL